MIIAANYADKKLFQWIFVIGSFLCLLCLAYQLSEGRKQKFSAYFIEESEYDNLLRIRRETKNDLLEEISFDGQALVCDVGTDTFYYSLNEGSASAYNPTVALIFSDKSAKLAVKQVQMTDAFIEKNGTIELVVYTDELYKCYYLKETLLPIMEISCSETDSEMDVPMSIRLYDNRADAIYRVSTSDGQMHIRGGTSRNYPKKGYKLSLENPKKLPLLGMRNDDDWILYAAYNDQERIRNVFATELWKEGCAGNNAFGLDNGVEYKFVELFMNGSYYGLYALGYPVDNKVLGTADKEYVYKKKYWDWEAADDLSALGEISGYELCSECDDVISAWQPLRDYYKLLYSAEQVQTGDLLSKVDVANSIDLYIFLNLVQGADHVDNRSIHNVYITAKRKSGDYVMLYTPWDMDQTWGNIWSDDAQNWCDAYGVAVQDNYVLNSGVIAALVNRNEEQIVAEVAKRYEELRKGAWSNENINMLLDDYETDIYKSGAYLRDMERWPDATSQNPEYGLGLFREYVMNRLEYLDWYYADFDGGEQ